MDPLARATKTITTFQIPIGVIGLIFNFFHIVILTRSGMRSNATNVLIIAISICDIIFMLFHVNEAIKIRTLLMPSSSLNCPTPPSWIGVFGDLIFTAVKDMSRRSSAWFGVSLAFVRCLVVKYAQQGKFLWLTEVATSWKIVSTVFLTSFFITSLNYGRAQIEENGLWIPAVECSSNSQNSSVIIFKLGENPFFAPYRAYLVRVYLALDGAARLFPPITYPFFTAILILELQKVKTRRIMMTQSSRQDDNVTSFVTFMTITYMVTETPVGASYWAEFLFYESFSLQILISNLNVIFTTLQMIVCSVHFFMCISISSQYRSAVQQLCGYGSRKFEN